MNIVADNITLDFTSLERTISHLKDSLKFHKREMRNADNQDSYRLICKHSAYNLLRHINKLKKQRVLVPYAVDNPNYTVENVLEEFDF